MAPTCGAHEQCNEYTHVKNAQLVTNLQKTCSKSAATTCWQDVLALVVPSLLTSCYKATSLQQTCYKLDELNSLVTIQVVPTTCYQVASQQLVNKLWVTNLVQLDKITALLQTFWQACYKLVASTTCWQVVRFCVCISESQFKACEVRLVRRNFVFFKFQNFNVLRNIFSFIRNFTI